ncbi:pyrroloquinoline quinone (coenzyme PQQ) biosynthesis protein C [Candidatus Nitrososphaera evergladensis SR1]|uniref:Pyrroloquinoline quinone (Coenzyme PQQ) biosynthesis protein C n=1 Tax=Candidatus Nitrososphaera evergladensis SR1 TaxID=1459636 RepID=A0A075MTR3_9ARCH|nr:iron-containing redox enzyme family protein [Candidatus Nitrososphaera evergladensis]AIF84575.1 pyrroloquinoline quinone (coenzyme PQQ) biosynthesis protein C [Candidatus Nitrososphaera evergladensis SR1]
MAFEVRYNMENYDLVERIDSEIENRSLLKHPFYQMWSEGRLTVDHLQGYSKEYFQLVKAVPAFVQNIASAANNTDPSKVPGIKENLKEESEHIEPWARFAGAMGVSQSELASYAGAAKTNDAVAKMMSLTLLSFEEAVAAMYAFEAELPKISRSKIDGLAKFYGMTGNKDALNYFEIHEDADVRHAQVWRDILQAVPAEKREKAFAAAVESLKAQNLLLDSVQEKYVGSMYC